MISNESGLLVRFRRARSTATELWSTVDFASNDHTNYARLQIVEETRSGVRTLAALFVFPMLGVAFFAPTLGLDRGYSYGFLALAALAIHIFLSSRAVREIEALHLLGMVLLVVSGTTFVLIAHRTGALSTVIFACVGLLFMAIPSMPWGLREGSIAAGMIYGLFTGSTWSIADRFPTETLWTMQLYMAASAVISVTLVGRSAFVRRREMMARFDLEQARNDLETLSNQDALTGLWNRRYLRNQFDALRLEANRERGSYEFVLVDLDDFKGVNDRFGHLYGDRVLCWAANALETAVGKTGSVARIGGDEFVCLVPGGEARVRIDRATALLEEMVRASDEFEFDAEIPTFSFGIIEIPDGDDYDLEAISRRADRALYEHKRKRVIELDSASTDTNLPSGILSERID